MFFPSLAGVNHQNLESNNGSNPPIRDPFLPVLSHGGNSAKELRASPPLNAAPVWNNGLSAICGTGFNPVSCR